MDSMSKRERVAAAVNGAEVDRVPISFWGHDYLREWSAEEHAAQTLEFVARHDFDYVKLNPRFSYLMEAWGAVFAPSGNEQDAPHPVHLPIREAENLRRLTPAPAWSPSLVEQLRAARLVIRGLAADRPAVQTLFTPLAVLGYMTGGGSERLRTLLKEAPADGHAALAAVTETLSAYAVECLNAGLDGLFLATVDWASRDTATEEEYLEFGRPYDLQVLAALREARLLILHVCRRRNLLERLLHYPVHVFHWDVHGDGNSTLADIARGTPAAVSGGISTHTLHHGTPDEVAGEARAALSTTDGRRLLLAGACSISPQTPEANIRAALSVVRG